MGDVNKTASPWDHAATHFGNSTAFAFGGPPGACGGFLGASQEAPLEALGSFRKFQEAHQRLLETLASFQKLLKRSFPG